MCPSWSDFISKKKRKDLRHSVGHQIGIHGKLKHRHIGTSAHHHIVGMHFQIRLSSPIYYRNGQPRVTLDALGCCGILLAMNVARNNLDAKFGYPEIAI